MEGAEQSLGVGLSRVAGHHRARGFMQQEIQADEQMGNGLRRFVEARGEHRSCLLGRLRESLAARDGGQTEQGEHSHGIAGELGSVVIILAAQNEVPGPSRRYHRTHRWPIVEPGEQGFRQSDGKP